MNWHYPGQEDTTGFRRPFSENQRSSHFPGYWTKDFWPPNSPDLNPMDFAVWGYLQQKVSKSRQSLNALKASLQKAWDDIDVTFLRPTVMSVEKRLEACIAAREAHFEYLLD
ncbi:unnamed protein product [Heligmosomoides polygyrus]|uniref:DDE_3 domain-containing protein n=1 Tax=Heligmosomoides polygyrus TaxID=6339 RepID=A0A183FRE3_HELPZ|nr:unnamed protein product [Heligmosomoides polygyrus]